MVEQSTHTAPGTQVPTGSLGQLLAIAEQATQSAKRARAFYHQCLKAYVKWGGMDNHDKMVNAHREARRLADAACKADSEALGTRTYIGWN